MCVTAWRESFRTQTPTAAFFPASTRDGRLDVVADADGRAGGMPGIGETIENYTHSTLYGVHTHTHAVHSGNGHINIRSLW